MDSPVVFRQKRNWFRLEFKFWPDYVEYYARFPSNKNGGGSGFSVRYEFLPSEFACRMFISDHGAIQVTMITIALVALGAFAGRDDIYLMTCGLAAVALLAIAGARASGSALVNDTFTALATQQGSLLVARDKQHEEIIRELQVRRLAALRKSIVINHDQPAWTEVKRFKWLRDEGVISAADFAKYRQEILAVTGEAHEKAVENVSLH